MNRNITAIILIVLSFGIYFTVTEGMIADAKAVQGVNAQYGSAIQSAVDLIRIRDKVQNDYKNLGTGDQDRLDKMIPSSVDNIRLVIDLNNIALQHGFSLKGIKAATAPSVVTQTSSVPLASSGGPSRVASTVIPAPILDTVAVSFSVSAPYQQFISFLQDLEGNLRIMDVSRLSVTSTENGIYTWNVEIKTYWLRQQ
jgi:Tfp pilus assembly protein PilO